MEDFDKFISSNGEEICYFKGDFYMYRLYWNKLKIIDLDMKKNKTSYNEYKKYYNDLIDGAVYYFLDSGHVFFDDGKFWTYDGCKFNIIENILDVLDEILIEVVKNPPEKIIEFRKLPPK